MIGVSIHHHYNDHICPDISLRLPMRSKLQSKRPPVILLAFANEDGKRRLPNLQEERDELQDALEPLQTDGLCKLVVEPIATLDRISKRLAEFGDRLAIFHFAGHAAARVLQFENSDGGSDDIDAKGFARLLCSGPRTPDVVFLNGCSSGDQAEELLNNGVLAVIGTTDAIDDNVATKMSALFYQRIAAGGSITQAFDLAAGHHESLFKSDRKRAFRDAYFENSESPASTEWPWQLHPRTGDRKRVEEWSIHGLQNKESSGTDATLLGYMCDRKDQIDVFLEKALPEHDADSANRPLGLIVHGPLGEAHVEFVRRIHEWDLPRYLQARSGVARPVNKVSIDWKNDATALQRELAIALTGRDDAAVNDIQQSIIESRASTIVETTVGIGDWSGVTPGVIRHWLNIFAGFGDLPKGQLLLPVVVILEKPSPWDRLQFWKTMPERFVARFGAPESMSTEPLPQLEPVPMDAVTDQWLRQDFEEQAKDLIDELNLERNYLVAELRPFVKTLYQDEGKDALPMEDLGDRLAVKIQNILQETR